MKLRHLILFILASLTLMISSFPGGSLIGLFVWLQVTTLMTQNEFSKKSQIWAAYLFLISIPLVLFWGSCHAFLFIYFAEQSWMLFAMSFLASLLICCAATVYFMLPFQTAEKAQYKLFDSLNRALQAIKSDRKYFFMASGLIFTTSLVPIVAADWKIVFAIMATHLILYRRRLKQVFELGF